MKKIILATGIIFLVGCTGEETVKTLDNNTKEIEQNEEQVANSTSSSVSQQQVGKEEFEQIKTGMKDYKFISKMDNRDTSTYLDLIEGLIMYGKVEQDGGTLDYFMGYSEVQIVQKMKQLYNIDLKITEFSLPSPSNPSTQKYLHYENGIFYVPPIDYYGDVTIRDVTDVKKTNDNMYLVTFTDTFFDSMNYHFSNENSQFDPTKFEDIPIVNWPKDTHDFISTSTPRYAVVELKDGLMKLHYIGDNYLTEEELKSF